MLHRPSFLDIYSLVTFPSGNHYNLSSQYGGMKTAGKSDLIRVEPSNYLYPSTCAGGTPGSSRRAYDP